MVVKMPLERWCRPTLSYPTLRRWSEHHHRNERGQKADENSLNSRGVFNQRAGRNGLTSIAASQKPCYRAVGLNELLDGG